MVKTATIVAVLRVILVEQMGVEPTTYTMRTYRSSQLSYCPNIICVQKYISSSKKIKQRFYFSFTFHQRLCKRTLFCRICFQKNLISVSMQDRLSTLYHNNDSLSPHLWVNHSSHRCKDAPGYSRQVQAVSDLWFQYPQHAGTS